MKNIVKYVLLFFLTANYGYGRGTITLKKPVRSQPLQCITIAGRELKHQDTISASILLSAGKLDIAKNCSDLLNILSFDVAVSVNGGDVIYHSNSSYFTPDMMRCVINTPSGGWFGISHIKCVTVKDSNYLLKDNSYLTIVKPVLVR